MFKKNLNLKGAGKLQIMKMHAKILFKLTDKYIINEQEEYIIFINKKNSNKVYAVKGISKEIIQLIKKHKIVAYIFDSLSKEYKVDKEKLKIDLYTFLNEMLRLEIIEIDGNN